MEKHKLILISIVAGVAEAILLFIFFSFGALIGSHLRFYGYRRVTNKNHSIIDSNPFSVNVHELPNMYIAQIESIKNGELTILDINKKHYTFNLSSTKVFSFVGHKESQTILSINEYILIRKIGKNLVIRVL